MAMLAPVGAAMAAASPYIGAASAGLTVVGGLSQSAAQRQAGDIAYQNALIRAQQAQQQAQMAVARAQQEDQNADSATGAGQIQQVEKIRQGNVMAGRARAVMAASGGGVDEGVISAIQGENNYAGSVAAFNANERARGFRNQATMDRYSAENAIWGGQAGVGIGASERDAGYRAADATLIGSFGKAALSFASKYGGDAPTPKTSPGAGDFTSPWGTGGLDDASLSRFPV